MTFAAVAQIILGYGFLYLFHGDQTLAFLKDATTSPVDIDTSILAARAAAAWSWQNIVQRFWMTYVIAGGVEEMVKVLAVRFALHQSPPADHQDKRRLFFQYAVSVGLGYSIVESLLCLPGLANSRDGWIRMSTEVGERILYGSSTHVLTTALSSLRMLQSHDFHKSQHKNMLAACPTRVWSLFSAVGPSAIYHGTGNFLLFSISAMNGNLLWHHPWDAKSLAATYTMCVGLVVILGCNVQRKWQSMRRK